MADVVLFWLMVGRDLVMLRTCTLHFDFEGPFANWHPRTAAGTIIKTVEIVSVFALRRKALVSSADLPEPCTGERELRILLPSCRGTKGRPRVN